MIEARLTALSSLAEAEAYARDLTNAVALSPPGPKPVLCGDHRLVTIYSQPVSDRLAELFATMNSRLECTALLVAPANATFAMQLGRIVREANNPSRRLFTDAHEAAAFLGESLDETERGRLGLFLAGFEGDDGEGSPPPPRSGRVLRGSNAPPSTRLRGIAGG